METELLDAKADEAARKKATEMQAKIAEAQNAGKTFYQAAEALGLKPEPLPMFSAKVPPMGKNEYTEEVIQAANNLAPGKVSEVINADKDALIVNVDRRSLWVGKQSTKTKPSSQKNSRKTQMTAQKSSTVPRTIPQPVHPDGTQVSYLPHLAF